MRRHLLLTCAGLLLLAACTDQSAAPAGPAAVTGSGANALPAACSTPTQIRAQIAAVFPAPSPLDTANKQFNKIEAAIVRKDTASARELALGMVSKILARYYAGGVIGGQTEPAQTNVITLIKSLFCYVGLPAPPITPGSLGPDGVIGVVGPLSPRTVLVTQTQFAGIDIPAANTPTSTLISVTRLPDTPGPLLTPLDQYPAFYEYTATPAVTFSQDMIVGTCQVATFSAPDFSRLRMAHNVGPAAEILPRVTAPFLNCTSLIGSATFAPGLRGYAQRGWQWFSPLVQALVLPEPAYATALGTCCLGGTTKKFSPFGAVDTLTVLDRASAGSISGAPNSAVPAGSLPTVTLITPAGKRVPGATVTFSIPAGNEGSITGAVVVTDALGRAQLGGWTLGPGFAPNGVVATVTPLPNTEVGNNGLGFTATVTVIP